MRFTASGTKLLRRLAQAAFGSCGALAAASAGRLATWEAGAEALVPALPVFPVFAASTGCWVRLGSWRGRLGIGACFSLAAVLTAVS